MMKTVIYARRSTMKANQSDTIDNQIKICKRRAKEIGLKIVDIKTDTGTATQGGNREDIKELIKEALVGKYECVIMKGVSRFYRDVEEGLGLIKRLHRSKIRVITIEENFDSLKNVTGTGQLDTSMIAMYLVFAENESKKLSERIKHTQIEKAHAGEWNQVSSIPIGYAYDKETKKLKIDLVKSEIVKLTFKMYLEGVGMKTIAQYLNGENEKGIVYPSSRGGKWNQYTISYLLKNQVYVGDIVFNKRSKTSRPYKNPEQLGKSPDDFFVGSDYNEKEKWIITKNAHEPIISREDFEKAQSIMASKAKRKGIKSSVSLLASIAKCGKCGSGMTYKRGAKDEFGRVKSVSNYYCSGYIKYGNSHCDSHHVRAIELEDIVIDRLTEKIKEKLLFEKVTSNIKAKKQNKNVLRDKIRKVEMNLENLMNKTNVLLNKNMAGDITDLQFKEMNKTASQEMEMFTELLLKLKREYNEEEEKDVSAELKNMYEKVINISEYPLEKKRYLLIDLIDKIKVTDGNIDIVYRF